MSFLNYSYLYKAKVVFNMIELGMELNGYLLLVPEYNCFFQFRFQKCNLLDINYFVADIKKAESWWSSIGGNENSSSEADPKM